MFKVAAITAGVVLGVFGLGVVGVFWWLWRFKWGQDYEAEGSE